MSAVREKHVGDRPILLSGLRRWDLPPTRELLLCVVLGEKHVDATLLGVRAKGRARHGGKFFTTPRISSTRGSRANTESSLRIASDEVNNFEPHRVPATAPEACGHPLARARPSRLSALGRKPLGDSVEYIYPVTKARVAAQIPGRYGHISC